MCDLIIVGCGPAGLSAGITAAEFGLDVLLLDEYLKPGGRLLGQLYEESNGNWWNGIEESRKLIERAEALDLDIRLGISAHNIEQDGEKWLVHTSNETFAATSLLLATGAAESPIAVPGWTLPGVMSVGAAQVMTNVHRVKPGQRGVIIGVNVLSSVIAMELKLAGVEVAAIALPTSNQVNGDAAQPSEVMNSLLHVSHLAPSAFVKIGSKLMKNNFLKKMGLSFYPKNGVRIWDIPVLLRKAVLRINGTEQVEGVTLATVTSDGNIVPGTEEVIGCDFVCIAGGLYPLAELIALTGCPFYHIEELGGYIPLHSEEMRTPLHHLYVAGNITGIEGAKVAMSQGQTAALSIAKDSGKVISENSVKDSIHQIISTRDALPFHFHPEVEAGRRKLQQYWEDLHREKSKVLVRQ